MLRSAESTEQLQYGQQLLVDLHQKRRNALGEPGCFGDDRFKQFYLNASDAHWKKDQWEVQWMEVDGAPVAAQTGCWMNGIFYMYQSGYDPAFESVEPGWMMNVGTLRRAINERWKAIDFMRGDERYKSMLRATPTPCLREQLCHSAWDSRTRFAAVGFAQQAKRWWEEKSQTAASE